MRARIPCRPWFLVAAWLAVSVTGVQARQDPPTAGVPQILQSTIASYQNSLRGVIGMQRHFTTIINAGIAKHSEQSSSGLLLNSDDFAGAHYYRIVDDGKAFTAAQVKDRDTQTNQGWSAGKIFFKEPYDRRFVADYTFTTVSPCTTCPTGTVAITFSSGKHDDQHGSGTMWIDSARHRVVKLTYVPYALPQHATSGTVTETSGQALPNLWYVVRIDEVYAGRELLFRGTGTFTGIMDHFQRFATLAAGKNALANGTIGAVQP